MRFQAFLILIAAIFVVTGCGGRARYDGRLVQADSLMWSTPDSALAVLSALDTLRGAADSAYRDLLLTQARYKTYQDITASDDSAITRALHWYRAHSDEREKLTRATLYKGAVMEELDHIDSAMIYYKTAESTAAPGDYTNLGYSKMRIASLYQKQHSPNDAAIARIKDAISCFEHINDTTFLISCYGTLGAISGTQYPDSAKYYLNRAIHMAQLFDPAQQYTFKSKLAGIYYYHYQDYPRANRLAMDVLRNGSEYCLEYQFYYYATMTYLKMGLIDSAKYVLENTPAPIDAVDSMNLLDAAAEVAKAEGGLIEFGHNAIKSREKKSQILADSKETQLVRAENEFDKQKSRIEGQIAQRRGDKLAITLILAALSFAFVLYVTVLIMRKNIRIKEKERDSVEKELNNVIRSLRERLDLKDKNYVDASTLVKYRFDAFQELFDCIKFKANSQSDGSNRKRRIITLSGVLSGLSNHYSIMKVEPSNSFWEKIRLSVDGEFNGLVSYVEQHYPMLTARDLNIFCLLCTDVSPQIIKLCLNLTSARTASNYRGQMMKKMGLDITFNEFIQKFENGECQ